jgi:hypothetical protein
MADFAGGAIQGFVGPTELGAADDLEAIIVGFIGAAQESLDIAVQEIESEIIVAIEEVVTGQVFTGHRTSLCAGSASQVFSRSGTASEDKAAGHSPEGSDKAGHAFKTGGASILARRVRFPSASATRKRL